MNRGKFFWWAQFAPISMLRRRAKRLARLDDSLHMLRDAEACLELMPRLLEQRDFGGTLLNFPRKVFAMDTLPAAELPRLTASDLVLMTTRPALDDDPEFDKRTVLRTRGALEERVLETLRGLFLRCHRGAVILSDTVACKLEAQQRTFRAVKFHVNNNAEIWRLGDVDREIRLERSAKYERAGATAGYAVSTPLRLNGQEARLLCVFGLNGAATLAWTFLLRTQLQDLLGELATTRGSRVVVAEFVLPPETFTETPIDLSFLQQEVSLRIDLTWA